MVKRLFVLLSAVAVLAGCAYDANRIPPAPAPPPPSTSAPVTIPDDDTRLLAVAIGAPAGSQLGGSIGRSLNRDDRERMQEAAQRALETAPTGDKVFWRNPESGAEGTITPQGRFTTAEGRVCREFQQTVTAQGRTATAYGTACKQADGAWRVVSG